jgi:hypothetical protein
LIVSRIRLSGASEYVQSPLSAKVFNVPIQALQVGVAGCGGDDEKIGPAVHFPQIEDRHAGAFVFPKQFPQSQGGILTGGNASFF